MKKSLRSAFKNLNDFRSSVHQSSFLVRAVGIFPGLSVWLGVVLFALFVTPAGAFAQPDSLLITRICDNCDANGAEWVEVFNPTGSDLTLTNFEEGSGANWSGSQVVSPGEFILFYDSGDGSPANATGDIDEGMTPGTDEGFRITQSNGDTDAVGWGAASNGYYEGTAITEGVDVGNVDFLQRRVDADKVPLDRDDNSQDFLTVRPKQEYDTAGLSTLVISRVCDNCDANGAEWVEVFNPTGLDLTLTDFEEESGASWSGSRDIGSGEYVLFYDSGDGSPANATGDIDEGMTPGTDEGFRITQSNGDTDAVGWGNGVSSGFYEDTTAKPGMDIGTEDRFQRKISSGFEPLDSDSNPFDLYSSPAKVLYRPAKSVSVTQPQDGHDTSEQTITAKGTSVRTSTSDEVRVFVNGMNEGNTTVSADSSWTVTGVNLTGLNDTVRVDLDTNAMAPVSDSKTLTVNYNDTNLIFPYNWDMERSGSDPPSVESWREWGSSTGINQDCSLSFREDCSLQLQNLTGSYSGREVASETITVSANEDYQVRTYLRITNEASASEVALRVQFAWYDSSGNEINSEPAIGSNLSATQSWEELTYSAEAPASADKARVLISAKENTDVNFNVNVDHVEFVNTTIPTVGVTNFSDGHDTNVRSITVSGTTAATDSGDSVGVTVNGGGTVTTSVGGAGNWSTAGVSLQDMGDSLVASIYESDSTSQVLDTQGLTINFDNMAETYPLNFSVQDTRAGMVRLNWTPFSTTPGSDPDTGVGFDEYQLFYDTQVTPDSTSARWDSNEDADLGDLTTDLTTISGFNVNDTVEFRIGYADRLGNISQLSDTIAADPGEYAPNADSDGLVITRLVDSGSDEILEIFNPTQSVLKLVSYEEENPGLSGQPGRSVSPGEFVYVGSASEASNLGISGAQDINDEASFNDANEGVRIITTTPTGDTISDALGWDKSGDEEDVGIGFYEQDVFPNSGSDYVMYRDTDVDGIPVDSDNNTSDFVQESLSEAGSLRSGYSVQGGIPGELAVLSPEDGYETDVRSIIVSGTTALAREGDSISAIVNSDKSFYGSVAADSTWSIPVTIGDSGNQVKVGVHTADTVSAFRDTEVLKVVYDDTPPTVPKLSTPEEGAETDVTDVNFKWEASSDSITGVESYRVEVDTQTSFNPPTVRSGTTTSTDTNFVLDPNDTYAWRVFALDSLNNESASSAIRTVGIDTEPPSVDTGILQVDDTVDNLSLKNLSGDSVLRDNIRHRVRVSITGADTATLYQRNDGAPPSTSDTAVAFQSGDGDSWSADIPNQNFSEGDTIAFIIQTSDTLGNTVISDSEGNGFQYGISGAVENTPPTVNLTSPGSGSVFSGDVPGTYVISDPQDSSGTLALEVKSLPDGNWKQATLTDPALFESVTFTVDGETGTFTWDSSSDFPDQYDTQVLMRLRATDGDSFGEYDTTGTFTVDNRGRDIKITDPASGHDTNIRSVTVSGTTALANTGDSVLVAVNGDTLDTVPVRASSTWNASVTFSQFENTIGANLLEDTPGSRVTRTDTVSVRFDASTGTPPLNLTRMDTGDGLVRLGWTSFSDTPGTDPDTGVGFNNYVVFYDTQTVPDSNSPRWTINHDTELLDLSTDTTVVEGLKGDSQYHFVIAYEDALGNVSAVSNSVSATPSTFVPPNAKVVRINNSAAESAVVAGRDDTITVRVVWRNNGSLSDTVTIDSGALNILNNDNSVREEFAPEYRSSRVVTVHSRGDTETVTWSLQVPSEERVDLVGNFTIQYGSYEANSPLNVARNAEKGAETSDGGLDYWKTSIREVELNAGGGTNNGISGYDPDVVPSDSDIIVTLQSRSKEHIDTPLINPGYGLDSAPIYDSTITRADSEVLKGDTVVPENGLFNLGVWADGVNPEEPDNYVGDETILRENVEVTVPDPVDSDSSVVVVKLTEDSHRWEIIDNQPEREDGTVHFNVPADHSTKPAGFSVFRILAVGMSNTGKASETIVYPNPFVPYDGDPETGEYGTGMGQGIHFAAGKNEGFPSGTELAVYTVTGEKITETKQFSGGIIRWNGRTSEGEPVSSGVYVYRIQTPDGSEKVGKLSVVR